MRNYKASLLDFLKAIPLAVSFYGGSPWRAIKGIARILKKEGPKGISKRIHILSAGRKRHQHNHLSAEELYGRVPAPNKDFCPKISIIVPNYNHAPYLRKRLESIYQQSYQNIEILLMDDCSTDNSREILQEYATRYPQITTVCFNDHNSGSVFKQWKKGFEWASGDLIWIAESDDYCDFNFLEAQLYAFQNPAIRLSFCKTFFVLDNNKSEANSLQQYLWDLSIINWDKDYLCSAYHLVKEGWGLRNIIPNVSGALFRHPRDLPLLNDPQWLDYRLCGDWAFYLHFVRGGLVYYTPNTTNYYRQHTAGTSILTQQSNIFYQEYAQIAHLLFSLYPLQAEILDRQEQFLLEHWQTRRGKDYDAAFFEIYNKQKLLDTLPKRKPNIMMVAYALVAGGGETFPIMLSNLLYEQGYGVTLLNCHAEPTNPEIAAMMHSNIAVFEASSFDHIGALLTDLGIDIAHSHHAWVDITLATYLTSYDNIKHLISMHGMYEMMEAEQLNMLLPILQNNVDQFVYTADKNISTFPDDFIDENSFCKIRNALPHQPIQPVDLQQYGITQNDFTLCLVSRAIPEKGWEEGIQAVLYANKHTEQNIHLLLIGEGEEYDRLAHLSSSPYVHFLGFRKNIRDYYAACDLGFLPSRFPGESAPLVLIDCLYAGKPFLASDIGEIKYMLKADERIAGQLFTLSEEKTIDVEALGNTIIEIATNKNCYYEMKKSVEIAVRKFSTQLMIDSYAKLYHSLMKRK